MIVLPYNWGKYNVDLPVFLLLLQDWAEYGFDFCILKGKYY